MRVRVGDPFIQREDWDQINRLALLYLCACPKPVLGCPTSYVVVSCVCSVSEGQRLLFVLLILLEMMTIIVQNFFS